MTADWIKGRKGDGKRICKQCPGFSLGTVWMVASLTAVGNIVKGVVLWDRGGANGFRGRGKKD